jgi:hypothetical protein
VAQVTVQAQYVADTAQYVRALRQAADSTTALANVIPKVIPVQQQMASGARDMGQAAQDAGKGFTILRNAMGTAIGVAAVNMVGKMIGSLKGFAKESFDVAARVEELDIAMKAIGESTGIGAQAIQEATQAIRDNGIELGAAQQIAIEFAQNQLDLASASKVARVAQDLAVIAGKNSTATTQMLTRAIITGNSMLLKSAGISRQAGEAYKEYATSLGKTTKQLTAQERQMAVTNLIIEEGAKVAGTYEASMNSAGKVLRSFKRIVNDIQVEIGKVLLQAFGPLIKSTYDLLSAFSKTLREGGALSGTLSALTESFTQITEPINSFIKSLTASVKSGELLERLNTVVSSLIPLIETLFLLSQTYASVLFTALGPALRAVTAVLDTMLAAIKPLIDAFNRMPEIVKFLVGGFILLQIAMHKSATAATVFGASLGTLTTRFTLAFRVMTVNVKAFEIRIKTAMIAAKTQMGALVAAARVMAMGVVNAFRAVGAAAKGLMMSLGPVGWALLAVSAAMEFFMGKAAASEHHLSNLRDGIDKTTLKLNDLGEAFIRDEFSQNFSSQTLLELQSLGIGVDEMISALQNGGEEYEALIRKLQSPTARDVLGPFGADTVRRTIEGMSAHYKTAQNDVEALVAVQQMANEQTQMSNRQMAQESIKNYQEISAAQIIAAQIAERSAGEFTTQAQRQEAAMGELSTATAAAVQAMSKSFDGLKNAISIDANIDSAHDALLKMREQLRGSTAGVDNFSKGAKENRKVIRDYATSMLSFAQSLKDPQEQLEVLKATEAEVRKELKKKGIKPKDSAIYTEIKQAVDDAESAVGEMGDAVANAQKKGVDVTEALVAGIVDSIEDNKGIVEAAGQGLGDPLVDGLMDELGISSPSKVSMAAGTEVVNGLIIGLQRGHNPLAAAMRNLIKAGLTAARKEAAIASPSKKGVEIGGQIGDGVAKGMTGKTPEMRNAAKRSVADLLTDMGKEIDTTGKKVAKKAEQTAKLIASSFSKGFAVFDFKISSGSLMDQLQASFGSLPALPSPLEQLLGKEGSEKWLKKHEKSLIVLQRTFGEMDQVRDIVQSGAEALRQIHSSMTGVQGVYKGEPIEAPSELIRALGSSGNLGSAIGMLQQLKDSANSAFNSLIALSKGAVKKGHRAAKKAMSGYVEAMRQEVSGLMIRRDQITSELDKLSNAYNKKVSEINDHYGRLEKAANKVISGLEDKWSKAIPPLENALRAANEAFDKENRVLQELISKRDSFFGGISSGFRSFVNSLTFPMKKIDKEIAKAAPVDEIQRTIKEYANGLRVTIETKIKPAMEELSDAVGEEALSGADIREALESRLSEVRAFAANIQTLMARGLDSSLIQDFVSAGVSGAGEAAAALVSATDEELQAINAAQGALASEVAAFSQYASQQWFDAGIAQQEAIVAPLLTAAAAAQAALDIANTTRDAELLAARNHLQALQNAREEALEKEATDYAAHRGVLEAEAALIDKQLDDAATAIRDYFASLMSGGDGKKGLPVMMRQTGNAAMRGLLRGLKDMEPAVMNKARAIARSIRHEIESALAIRSPSRVMETIGGQIAQGLIDGMESSERAVERAALSLAGSVIVPVSAPTFNGLSAAPAMGMGIGGYASSSSVNNTFNVNVQTGIGTDPAETGRQVVEAIRKYERRSGPVFVSA